jgi:hypothetical protein
MVAFGSRYDRLRGTNIEIEAPGLCKPEQVILLLTKVKDIFQRLSLFPFAIRANLA